MKRLVERREYLRVDINMLVREEAVSGIQMVRAVNISEAGIRYSKPASSPCRTEPEVFLEFYLPGDGSPVITQGHVVFDHHDEISHTASVAFAPMTALDARRIRRYVVRHKRAELFDLLRKQHLGEAITKM